MRILGIESSCDETGVAIFDEQSGLVANELYSQAKKHAKFGGVVPELASRDHVRKLLPLIQKCFQDSGLSPAQLTAIAYTEGPGLVGALLIGATMAKTLGMCAGIPTIGVHHMEGHLLAPFIDKEDIPFPFLALLVSGGHTELVWAKGLGDYELLGQTVDDAVGEAFDKTAKLLGLGYPGGPLVEKAAKQGKKGRFSFPRPMLNRPGLDFSFSGLKTFVANTVEGLALTDEDIADVSWAFQDAVAATLKRKCERAILQTGAKRLVIAGGVSANQTIRSALISAAESFGCELIAPDLAWCTDNGAMIAFAGMQYLKRCAVPTNRAIRVRARWPLTDLQG